MAKRNRKQAEAFILEYINKIDPSGENGRVTSELMSSMDDEKFDEWMHKFSKGKDRPIIITPNFSETIKLDVKRNLAIGRELGHDFFKRIWINSSDPNMPSYLSSVKYMIMELPFKRQAQVLKKGLAVAQDSKSIDQVSGQASGNSSVSRISYPELQVIAGMGLDYTAIELIKFRGGDIKGFNAMNTVINKDGKVSMMAIKNLSSGVESVKALYSYLTAMHLKNTL